MRKLIILATLIMTATSYGQLSDIEKADDAHVNLLKNPGFESSVSDWTISGGALIADSSELFGNGAAQFNASGGMQYMQGSAVVPKGLFGKACRAKIEYDYSNGASVAGDYQVYVYNVTQAAALTTPVDLTVTTATSTGKAHVGFTCPNVADEIALRIASCDACADEPSIILDAAWLGGDYLLSAVNDQAELIAHAEMENAASCFWDTTQADPTASFTPVAACNDNLTVHLDPSGLVNSATDDLPKIKFNSLPAGRYKVTATFTARNDTNGNYTEFTITDGTDSRGTTAASSDADGVFHPYTMVAFFEYTTDQGPHEFEIYGARDISGTTRLLLNRSASHLGWTVERFPTQSPRNQVTLETQNWFAQFLWYAPGANITMNNADQSNAIALADAGGQIELLPENEADISALCSGGNNPETGLTCSSGVEQVGFRVVVPRSGKYEICSRFNHSIFASASSANSAYLDVSFFLMKTQGDSSLTVVSGDDTAWDSLLYVDDNVSPFDTGDIQTTNDVEACRVFELTAGQHYFAIKYTVDAGTGGTFNHYFLTNNASSPSVAPKRNVLFKITPISQNFPQAVALVGNERVMVSYSVDGSTANTSIADSTEEVIDFNVQHIDTHNAVTTGTNWVFTAPRDGFYKVNFVVMTADNAWNGTESFQGWIRVDGVKFTNYVTHPDISGGAVNINADVGGGRLVYLNKDETIDILVWGNSGGALSVQTSTQRCHIDIMEMTDTAIPNGSF